MNTKSKTAKTAAKTAKTAPKSPTFASRALVCSDLGIDWGELVQVETAEGPKDYYKTPQDDPNALYGERYTSAAGVHYQKNAKVPPCAAALTGGKGTVQAQDVANARANLPEWARVAEVSGAILLGNETTHARAFHTTNDPKAGWCYLAGYAGIVFDPTTRAPHFNLKMKDPDRRRETARDDRGNPIGEKMTGTFTKAIFDLRPDQRISGGSAVLIPHGEASLASAASNQKVLDREGKRDAKAAGTKPQTALAPCQLQETIDGVAVVFEPRSGVSVRNWKPLEFTGTDARANAETKARILNNNAIRHMS